jgi:integrase
VSYVDELCKNLHLRVTCHGTKTFSVMARTGGRLKRTTLGKYPIWSLADARERALEIQRGGYPAVDVALTRCPTLATAIRPKGLTLHELIERYTVLHLRPNTRAGELGAKVMRQTAMAPLLIRDITTLERTELVEVLDVIVASGKPHAAGNLLKSLRAMFAWAVSRDYLGHNPLTGVRPPVRATHRDRILTDAEIVAVLNACDTMPASFGSLIRILLHTGARRNEIAYMKWGELEGNIWTLPAERSKNGRSNVLPLPSAVMQILGALPRYGADAKECAGHYVFTTTGGQRASSDFSKKKRMLDLASGTSGWRLHDLRRTCRTKMSQLGVPREVARKVIGHSVDTLDARYDQHDYRAEKAAALKAVADHLDSLVGGSIA